MISAVYLRVLHHTVKLRRRLGRAYLLYRAAS